MKDIEVEKGITISLEKMPDDCRVYMLSEDRLNRVLRVTVLSSMLIGASVMALGMIIRSELLR